MGGGRTAFLLSFFLSLRCGFSSIKASTWTPASTFSVDRIEKKLVGQEPMGICMDPLPGRRPRKSTQVPQYLLELFPDAQVAVTQPRRMAPEPHGIGSFRRFFRRKHGPRSGRRCPCTRSCWKSLLDRWELVGPTVARKWKLDEVGCSPLFARTKVSSFSTHFQPEPFSHSFHEFFCSDATRVAPLLQPPLSPPTEGGHQLGQARGGRATRSARADRGLPDRGRQLGRRERAGWKR